MSVTCLPSSIPIKSILSLTDPYRGFSLYKRKEDAIDSWLLERPELNKAKQELDGVIEQLDEKLDNQLKKQEHDYLKGYSIYVKTKEKELKTLIQKLNAKN